MMSGISRISINGQTKGAGSWRFGVAERYNDYVNRLYKYLFDIDDGEDIVNCDIDDKLGRYDRDFGVDVILKLKNGQTITVQEKILTTKYDTVTVEYYQNPAKKEEGDWFKLKCDLYFVGYGSGKTDSAGNYVLDRFILLDWLLVRLSSKYIGWKYQINKRDGARASFMYAMFNEFPPHCVIAKLDDGKFTVNPIIKLYKTDKVNYEY